MRSTHNALQGVVMTSFGGRWAYFKLCLVLTWPWYANARFQSLCLSVFKSMFSLHHFFENGIQVLSLTALWVPDFCHVVTLGCLIDTGVILKQWICICSGVVNAFDMDNLRAVLFEQQIHPYTLSKVKSRASLMKFVWSVTLCFGPITSLWTLLMFYLWLVFQFRWCCTCVAYLRVSNWDTLLACYPVWLLPLVVCWRHLCKSQRL